MAKKFYYDSADLLDATITAGTISGTSFSESASAVTNEHRIIDQSTSQSISSFDDEDGIRIDLSSNKAVDFILWHMSGSDAQKLRFYYSTNSTSSLQLITTTQDGELGTGWNIETFSSQSKRYWFIEAHEGTVDNITELILGSALTFENEPDIGIATQEIFATDLNTSLGGVEYANKRHEPKTTWQLNFSNISQTFKNNLVSFEEDVTNFKKFVYYDNSSYHYVRLDSPIKFTEVAFQRFSASLKLREQLS